MKDGVRWFICSDGVESFMFSLIGMCVGLAKANKDILVNDRLVDGAASDGMLIISIIQCIISSAKVGVM